MRLSLSNPLDALFAPPPRPDRVRFLGAQPYAHRGLHGAGVVENSREAFSAAVAKGLGIELDVQQAQGGQAMVFHDAKLDRLTDAKGPVAERTIADLAQIRLKGTDEPIPTLDEILALVEGRVPILIEIKADGHSSGTISMAVRRALEGYRGPVAVMSFHPSVGGWFHEHAPRIVRGLVVTQEREKGLIGRLRGGLLRRYSVWRAKPDFLAYDIRDLPAPFPAAQRKRGLKILTWTVRTREQERTAMAHADEIIFERPDRAG